MKEILDLDSKSAVTIFSSVGVTRPNPKDEMDIVDLENNISQAIWKLFDRSRANAAERLGVSDVDLLLTDARVMGVNIDGNKVINPHGFSGKKIDMLLGITMVKRDKFEESKHLFEGGSIRAYLLSKVIDSDEAVYIEVGTGATTIFSIEPSNIVYLNEFDWGMKNITGAIQEEFGVDTFAAEGMYNRYATGDVSNEVRKKIDKIFYLVFGGFVNGVIMGIKNFIPGARRNKQPVYLRTFFPIPEGVYRKKFAIDGRRISFLRAKGDGDLQGFIDDEIHETYKDLNQLAKRRIKWLMPNDYN